MPGFDGTGPRGEGPMSGRGEGYCAVKLPDEPGQPAYGYAGLQGRLVCLRALAVPPAPGTRFARRPRTRIPPHRYPLWRGWRRGHRAGRRRGRSFSRR